jgi:signal transduction histidine kinase
MIKLRSIKAKSIAYTLLVMLLPAIILGSLGTLYIHDIIKHNIENDYQEEAGSIADLTNNYLDRLVLYIESQAQRSALMNALDRNDIAALDTETEKINDATELYYWTFVTDASGRVLSSHPYGKVAANSLNESPYIAGPLKTGKTYIGSPEMNPVTGRMTIIIGTPVEKNGTIVGVLAGAINDNYYVDILGRARALEPLQDIFLVNGTGRVVFSHDKKNVGTDLSAIPAVQMAIRGEEGVDENSNFTGAGKWIVAYAPVPNYRLGAIVALSQDTAYGPINNATLMFAGGLALLAILAALLAIVVGNYLTRPVTSIAAAIDQVAEGVDISQSGLNKYLPYDRDDELGNLARNFKSMADKITAAREKIMGEKKHADMYIDVMGHDINNLNQAILTHLEIIKHYDRLDSQQERCLDGAIAATNESAAIIRNVKTVQAVTTEKPAMEKVDLDRVLQECIKEAPRPEGKKVAINYTPGKGQLVEAIPVINLAFCNVIKNAIKYSGAEVTIDIDVSKKTADGKKYFVTTIADDGNGIPEEIKETLFTRFQQGSPVPPGKGLGLYAAKVIIEQSGGSIKVENRVPENHNKGTRVIISLPAAGVPGE